MPDCFARAAAITHDAGERPWAKTYSSYLRGGQVHTHGTSVELRQLEKLDVLCTVSDGGVLNLCAARRPAPSGAGRRARTWLAARGVGPRAVFNDFSPFPDAEIRGPGHWRQGRLLHYHGGDMAARRGAHQYGGVNHRGWDRYNFSGSNCCKRAKPAFPG